MPAAACQTLWCVLACLLFCRAKCQGFYSFTAEDIRGNTVRLSDYAGKVSLVVNVASECHFTDGHYEEMVRLQDRFLPTRRFTVLAFPCNQFGEQEPGTNAEIHSSMTEKFGINFPMFAKVNVRDKSVPNFWKFLNDQSQAPPTWNFWKYLIDHEGNLVGAWGPTVPVENIIDEIQRVVVIAENAAKEEL